MSLLDRIKRENYLKEFVLNELNLIKNNAISDSEFTEKINVIENYFERNKLDTLEKAAELLNRKFIFKYSEFPFFNDVGIAGYELKKKDISLKLKEHIKLEKDLKPIILKIKNLASDYTKKNTLLKNETPNYFLYIVFIIVLIIAVNIMMWWWNYDFREIRGFRNSDGSISTYEAYHPTRFFVKIWRFIVFVISGAVTAAFGYYAEENYSASKDYNKHRNITDTIKEKENEIRKLITNANNAYIS